MGIAKLASAILAAATLVLAPSGKAAAQSPEAFYKANGLTIIVGYPPGAVYDLYARVLARHIGKHMPGRPTATVQNMAGAGSMTAANFIFNTAKKDGSQIGTFARGIAMQPLLDKQGVQFDATRFHWIGSTGTEVSVVFAWHTAPFKSADDLMTGEMTVAASGTGADSAIFPYVMNGVLGTRFKVKTGYPGASETMQAIERGEAQGSAGTSWGNFAATRQEWIKDKKVNILLQLAIKRQRELGSVPLVMDFAKTVADRKALELIFSRQSMAYPFMAPPGIPSDRLAALRRAFDQTMEDTEFLADARRQKLEIDPVVGEEIEALIGSVYASPPDVIARARAAILDGMGKTVSR
jgi:tripartite-type tricarboxylate transporter receptor subunit TctC